MRKVIHKVYHTYIYLPTYLYIHLPPIHLSRAVYMCVVDFIELLLWVLIKWEAICGMRNENERIYLAE